MKSVTVFNRCVVCGESKYYYRLQKEGKDLFFEGVTCAGERKQATYSTSALPYRDEICMEFLSRFADTVTDPSMFNELIREYVDFEWYECVK